MNESPYFCEGSAAIEEVRRLLGALACAGERTRYMLERASYGLLESNRRKRVNLHEITKMGMAE